MEPVYNSEKTMTNHPPKNDAIVELFEVVREVFKNAANTIDVSCPASREKSLAFTNLEQALMWAIASIARNQDQL